MEGFGMLFLAAFLLGIIVIVACLASLLTERKNKKEQYRTKRRRNLSETTVSTILGYQNRQSEDAALYRRRA